MRNFKFFIFLLLIFSFIFFTFSYCFAEDTVYVWSSTSNTLNTESNSINITNNNISNNTTINSNNNSTTNVSSSDVESGENTDTLNLESESAILIEQSTGKVLYSKNEHEQLRPASVTKVMSILLIMEAIDNGQIALTDSVPCSENAASMGGSQIWLDPRETLTVDEMLKAICVASANDCVVAMAEYIAGSEENFVQMMNDRAKELGMNDTTFKNCHGLDEDGHVTSSYDIALMSRELLLNHPDITKYSTIWMEDLRDGKSQLANTNKLIKNYKGATGLKTGSTGLALYNLSASATRDDLSLIAVIMRAPSTKVRFAEAEKLLDYGFNNFVYKEFTRQGDILDSVSVNKGVQNNVEVVFENNSGVLIKKGEDKNVEQTISINENISAPIEKGEKLGTVDYSINGEIISSVNLIANNSVDKINLFTMTKEIVYRWIDLLR